MRKLFLLAFALIFSSSIMASTDWFRYASISPNGDQIVFTYKGDLYLVSSSGGEAKPLTFHSAHDFMPVWSNDGSKISFASNRYGNFDVFIINATGGKAQRLTYHSASEYPYTFSQNDKEVIFGAARLDHYKHRQYPTGSQPEVYTVKADGGKVNQLWTIPAEDIQISKSGKKYIYHDKKGGENVFRKHHTSAITRDIWVYDASNNTHKMILKRDGEDRSPVYTADEKGFYYLSEESGCFNVHMANFENPNSNTQVTKFKDHPVRYLSMSDNGLLCYTQNGDLYTQKDGKSTKLAIHISMDDKYNNEQLIRVRGNVSEMSISPNGKEVAYIVRGEVFVSSVEGKMTKRITNTPAQEKFVSFSNDGKKIIYASERNAKWNIYETTKKNDKELYFFASTLLEEKPILENKNDNYEPILSPDGKELAFIENRNTLRIYNLESKKSRTILDGEYLYYMRDGDQYFNWSPDSKWLFVQYRPVMANSEVLLIEVGGNKSMINLTESGYGDMNPKWVNGGKQMLWFSNRHGMKAHANSGSSQLDVYTMFFTKDGWDKFNMTKEEYALWKELNKKDKKKPTDKKPKDPKKKEAPKKKEIKPLKFDWDGMKERRKRLTIHSASIGDAVLSKDGETLYYLAQFEKGMNLWTTNLRTKATSMLIKLGVRGGSLKWDKDMKKLFLLANGQISILDLKAKRKKPVSVQGEIMLDLAAERQHLFEHVWKRTESMFYITGYHGADWNALRKNYEPKLPSIGNDFEFAELLSEMLGELNVSHCGARYRGGSADGDATASFGILIDYDYKDDGLRIAEVLKDGPLDKDHIKVNAGMVIKSINGTPIKGNKDYAYYLNRLANKFTALEIYDPANKKSQTITMKPVSLRTESSLLYKRWVKKNEDEVNKMSNGTLAYVHVSGMSDGQYRNTYEKVMGKYLDRDALIIDTRFNGGGDLVGDLAMFLTGERFIDYAIESRVVGYEPGYRWNKPSLALVGEAQYSDGHCFACGYQDLGIGKLVGMPVPGTCSFAGWEGLSNGISWGSVPVSAKDKDGDWMENNETVPEIMVKNMPKTIMDGRDEQLEAAIKDLMKTAKK